MPRLKTKGPVRWATSFSVGLMCCASMISYSSNDISSESDDWKSLFNGEDLDGWVVKIHRHEVGENYANTFRVVDGVIQVNYDDYDGFGDRFGHIFYQQPFSSYHLKFEYRFTEQWLDDAPSYAYRNSGVMFHSQGPDTILKEQDWPISIEYQMLAERGDGKPRPTGNMCSPGTDVFYKGRLDERHCINSSSATYPPGEWVMGELIVYGDSRVVHKVNGKQVLEYTNPQIGGGVVSGFDPKVWVEGQPLKEGYIALQSEGQGVEFRDIKIKQFE
ncbi:DUF1080 domain-containing protein [Gilvimarinus sp. SDUM040013]|uniref:DUF1080 domain-containing protein n=1 Tax=Gilvimarinus gilvus TaxID=3058038 RepID=A0ABU4RX57_9GAMM|nr:DUF1080 domain-containing protein [Gilvimarinus sp. SDUM040013]MDO3386665.1 DUF1080 domain-containing protein [Gilvimarinus sp. SDUM040013]MDX6849448.1 DUF1080 domain-containing protein [Gilvimarinus sp. SDUM040013]